jgi:hypothetical protein
MSSTSRVLLRCLLAALAVSPTLVGCSARMLAGDAATAEESPRVNNATSAPVKDVPYCPGGNRASDCLFGANCRVTHDGCQVCQCLSP